MLSMLKGQSEFKNTICLYNIENFMKFLQCVQGAYGESAFEELDEIFYIVQPNNIF